MNLRRTALIALSAFSTLVLAACGGGGSGTFNNPPPPGGGPYYGEIKGLPFENTHRLIIRGNGAYWLLLGEYTPVYGQTQVLQTAFVFGQNIYSTDYADGTLYRVGRDPVRVNMNTVQSGASTTFSGNLVSATGSFGNAVFSGQNYSLNPLTPDGAWQVKDSSGYAVNLSVSGGLVSGVDTLSCRFSASMTLSEPGLYDVVINDSSSCFGLPGGQYTGIALIETAPSNVGQQLMLAAVSSNGRGISLSGVRQ